MRLFQPQPAGRSIPPSSRAALRSKMLIRLHRRQAAALSSARHGWTQVLDESIKLDDLPKLSRLGQGEELMRPLPARHEAHHCIRGTSKASSDLVANDFVSGGVANSLRDNFVCS